MRGTQNHRFVAGCQDEADRRYRWCAVRRVALMVMIGLAIFALPARAQIPDLTKGGLPTDDPTEVNWNLGPTGMRGWAYRVGGTTTDSRQILVTSVASNSPAFGVFEIDDVILGADGTGAVPGYFTNDTRKALGNAISDAEANNPADLKLIRWRSGSETTVTLTLVTLGTYAATAPYDCEKSSNVLAKCLNYYVANDDPGAWSLGALVLMAGNDPSNPSNTLYQARAKEWVYDLLLTPAQMDDIYSNYGHPLSPWAAGGSLIVLAEYYLQTGDTNVFPTIEAMAFSISQNHSWWGTSGHQWASPTLDERQGPIAGYGALSLSGINCFLGLTLARECGVTNEVVDAGISRGERTWASYAFISGQIPYGEMSWGPNQDRDINGKNGALALAFALHTNRLEEAKYFGRLTSLGHNNRQGSHAGPYFNDAWPQLGAAQVGEEAASRYFGEVRWIYELSRTWEGQMTYDNVGRNHSYKDFTPGLTTIIPFALPLRQLHITGRDTKPALQLSIAEELDTQNDLTFAPAGLSTNELFAAMTNWSPNVRSAAAIELGGRTADMAVLLPSLHQMATNTAAYSRYQRAAVCEALGTYHDPASVPTLVACLTAPESLVRWQASIALFPVETYADYKAAAMAEITNILIAVASTAKPAFPYTDDDPFQNSHTRMARLTFGMLLKNHNLVGLDRDILFAAARAVAQAPDQLERGWLSSGGFYDQLTYDEMLELADVFVQLTRYRAPANSMGGYDDKLKVLDLMAQNDVAEGIPACEVFAEYFSVGSATALLAGYAGQCLTVEPDPETLQWLYGYALTESRAVISNTVNAILSDTNPAPLNYWKVINAVTADSPTLTLPVATTMLRVDATNHVLRAATNSFYAWRKVYGPGAVVFSPNGTSEARNTTVSLIDGAPGAYRFEVTMSDTYAFTIVHDTVDVILYDVGGGSPSNTPPTAVSQSITAGSGTRTPVTLTGSDPEAGYLGFDVITAPTNGTLSGDAPDLLYTSDFGYEGADSFMFEVVDNGGLRATGTVSITVVATNIGVVVYEPFDYAMGPLLGQSGESELGLDGQWSNSHNSTVALTSGSWSYASIPSLGHSMIGDAPWVVQRRPIIDGLLNAYGMLADGGELWFSVFMDMGEGMTIGLDNGSAGPNAGPSVGLRIYGFQKAVYARANGIDGPYFTDGKYNGEVSWPAGVPHMLVVHCQWGATTQALDTVTVYRVVESVGQPFFVNTVLSTISTNIAQEQFTGIYFAGRKVRFDEFRVGPNYQSVLQGTVALEEDLTPPAPDPMVIRSAVGSPDGTTITLTAATAYDDRGVEYYFTSTSGNGHDSGWQESPVYVDSGLTPGATYTYTVMARDKSPALNVTAASAPVEVTMGSYRVIPYVVGFPQTDAEVILSAAGFALGTVSLVNSGLLPDGDVLSQTPAGSTTVPCGTVVDLVVVQDQTAPSPNPAAFATPPYPVGDSTVTMTAAIGSDTTPGVVEYLFTETSGNPGGTSSGWQTDPTYTDTGLAPSNTYSYTVTLRDSLGNVGSASAAASATPLSLVLVMVEDFEERLLGDLNGQNGWVAERVVVQTNVTRDAQAASLVPHPEGCSMTWTFGQGVSNVWTDTFVQPELSNSNVPPAGVAYALYFSTNRHPVVYDGTTPVELGATTINTGEWTRVTINSDRGTKTWSLYINGALAESDLAFYDDSAATNNTLFGAAGRHEAPAYVDDISLHITSPLLAPADTPVVTATAGASQIAIAWYPAAGATAYHVKRAEVSGGLYTVLTTTAGLAFVDTNVSAGVTYYYVVSASNGAGEGDDSSAVSALIELAPSLPAIPASVTATPGNNQVELSWDASVGATVYNVKRATAASGPYTTIATPGGATHTDATALNGTTYFYKVTAENAEGESTDSAVVTATPLAAPAVPDGVTATTTPVEEAVSLSWASVSDASRYNVKRSTTQGDYTVIASPVGTNFVDTSAIYGTTYYYVISALNLTGESENSSGVSATPMPPLPSVPTGLAAVAGARRADLRWEPTAFAKTYNVKRANAPTGTYTIIASPTGTRYTDAPLADSTTYYYVLSAVNASAESGDCDPVSCTTPTPPVVTVQGATSLDETSARVTGLLTAGDSAEAWLVWGAGDAGTDSVGDWDHVVSIGSVTEGLAFSSDVSSLATNTTYFYRYYVSNVAGSDWSDAADNFSGSPLDGVSWTPEGINIANLAPTDITSTGAYLNASLNTSATNCDVYVCYGTTDGGADVGAWFSVAYVGSWTNAATNVSYSASLLSGTTYYYTFMASNATETAWASPRWEFRTSGESDPSLPAINNLDGATGVTYAKALLIGSLTSTGGSPTTVTCYWNANSDPGITTTGWDYSRAYGIASATGTYTNDTAETAALSPGTTYYYRYRAANSYGDNWSGAKSFTTLVLPAVNNAMGATTLSETSAALFGELTVGDSADIWICWGDDDAGTGSTGDWDNVISIGSVTDGVIFSDEVSSLARNTTYFYRCYATNSAGTSWSDASVFSGTPAVSDMPSGSGVIVYTDFAGRIVSGATAQNIIWTVNGVNDPGAITAIDVNSTGLLAGLFNTTEAQNHFAPDLNVYNEGPWSVDVPLVIASGYESVTVSNVVINWRDFANTGVFQNNNYSKYYTLTIRDSSEVVLGSNRVATAYASSGVINIAFDPAIALSRADTYTFNLRVDDNGSAGNNPGVNALTVEGSYTAIHPPMVNLPPSAITDGQATLNGGLSALGTNYAVYVYYGATDGGTNAGAWAASATVGSWTDVSTNVGYRVSLLAGTTIYYTFMASNTTETAWASPSWQFATPSTSLPTYTITASASAGGSITPAGAVSVTVSNDQVFVISPDTGCTIADVVVDLASQGPTNSYTFYDVTASHTISASFVINQYTVIFDEGDHGLRTGGGALTQLVNHASAAVEPTITADANYLFTGWDSSAYLDVTSNMTITAQYAFVGQTNRAPVFTVDPFSTVDAMQDVAYSDTIAGSATDADGDVLTYAKVAGAAWLNVATNGALSGTPSSDDVGTNTFTVSVSDGEAAPVEATLQIVVNDWVQTLPFVETFETLALGELNGKNGWTASDTFVQSTLARGAQAASITSPTGYFSQTFESSATNVWTDWVIQPQFADPASMVPQSGATCALFFNTNGYAVAYNGTNTVVLTGVQVTTGNWVRVTVKTQYSTKTWDLYINETPVARDLGFYDASVTAFDKFGIRGGSAQGVVVDDISIDVQPPFVPRFIGTIIIFR